MKLIWFIYNSYYDDATYLVNEIVPSFIKVLTKQHEPPYGRQLMLCLCKSGCHPCFTLFIPLFYIHFKLILISIDLN